MSVKMLRRAADKLRTAGDEAWHSEPWCPGLMWSGIRHLMRNCDLEYECAEHGESDGVRDCGGLGMYDGRYIALMHPPVALALAGLLDKAADAWSIDHNEPPRNPRDRAMTYEAIAVARAILREAP